jgi:hypothetical protein
MKWVYIIIGILLFLLVNRLIAEYSFKGASEEIEVIKSGVPQ